MNFRHDLGIKLKIMAVVLTLVASVDFVGGVGIVQMSRMPQIAEGVETVE